ncbi:MAG: hypothetical protein R3B13_23540 [Polyangiaceae bacterium]
MAEAKRILRPLISVVLIGASVLGLLNVYGDNAEVVRQAERLACDEKSDCTARMTRVDRSPFAQTFGFALSYELTTKSGPARPRERSVRCARAFVLLGEYRCELSGG